MNTDPSSALRGRTAVVTGAAGFIGSHLCEHLVQAGARVRALARYTSANSLGWLDESPWRSEIEPFWGDVRDADSMRKAFQGAEFIFHLAALIGIPYSYEAPLSYVRTNVEGTLNVLQLAREYGAMRVIQTSTSEVYGTAREFPITETHPVLGQSPYSASKIASDQLAYSYFCSFKLPVVILRPFNTFGPRQSARAVIPTIISQALTRPQVRLGSQHPTRDLTLVGDTARGFIAAAVAPQAPGEVIQLGTGREVSVGDLAAHILRALGKEDLPIVSDDARVRPGASEIDRLLSSPAKAKKLLDWEPQHTLEEGLEQTIDWMRSRTGRFRADAYVV